MKDSALQERLCQDGFVKISFLEETDLQRLQECYAQYAGQHQFSDGGFHHTTHHTNDTTLIFRIDNEIKKLVSHRIEHFFKNINVLAANFMVKEPGTHTEFIPHQDWTMVDETKYYCVNIWTPLQDVNPLNGSLHFLKGSHQKKLNIRTAPTFPELFGKVMPLVYKHLTSVPLKAGEAVVFQTGVLHGSFANTSGKRRITAMIGIHSEDAPILYYYNTQKGNPPVVEKYVLTPLQFISFPVCGKPDFVKPVETFTYPFPQVTEEEFNQWYNCGLINRIKRVLSV